MDQEFKLSIICRIVFCAITLCPCNRCKPQATVNLRSAWMFRFQRVGYNIWLIRIAAVRQCRGLHNSILRAVFRNTHLIAFN